MRNVRFARALLALALITPVALTAAPVAAQDTQYATDGQADEARADMMQVFGMTDLAPGQYKWASDIPAAGQTKIVISLTDQLGYVYRAGQLIGVTTISSGKTDHETPTGVFPILGKEKVHHSRTYDNASMPFMQRLNNYGVALHGGNNPGYPASHGCVRLPMKFAARLFDLTQTGTPVIIEA
jgi:lipoprotein-anchoring transpeptidase ErfK/SrfK